MFNSLYSLLASLFTNMSRGFLSQVLIGGGVGILSFAGITAISNYYLDQFFIHLNQPTIVSSSLAILGIAGFDKALSILIGAYLASVYINTFANPLKLVKK